MQTVYAYSDRDLVESRRALASVLQSELTAGDVEIESSAVEVRASILKGLTSPITLMRVVNANGISFRRSWHHIHSKKAVVRLLYFIVQGELQVITAAGCFTVGPGKCTIINADEPFSTRTSTGDSDSFECVVAIVPEHMVLSHLPKAKDCSTAFEVDTGHRQLVKGLLDLLCFQNSSMSLEAAESLATAFLQSVADSVGDQIASLTHAPKMLDERFAEIQTCIQKYSTAADLTCDRIAEYCGLSARYVCYVLKANNTTYSNLLWSHRLSTARDWLTSKPFRRYAIRKVAGMAGFKSAAHFSRMFKSTYGMSPKVYRKSHAAKGGSKITHSNGAPAMDLGCV